MTKKTVKKPKPNAKLASRPLVDWLRYHDEELGQAISVADMDLGSLSVKLAALEEHFTGPQKAEGVLAEANSEPDPTTVHEFMESIDRRFLDLKAIVKDGVTEAEQRVQRLEALVTGKPRT